MHLLKAKQTVLVPIFGADITDDVFETARSLLDRRNSRLVLLHVVPSKQVEPEPATPSLDSNVEPRWHRLAEEAAPDRTFVEVVHGDPVKEILEEAERFESDAIVVGPAAPDAGAGWIARAIARLVRAAPRRVLIAPRRSRVPRRWHRAAAVRRRVFGQKRIRAA